MKGLDGIPNIWGERYSFAELPLWRKALCLVAAGTALTIMFVIGPIVPRERAKIYDSAPSAPNPASGQTQAVRVEGGYLRYVTSEQAESLEFWERVTGPSIGASLVIAVLVLFTYRPGISIKK